MNDRVSRAVSRFSAGVLGVLGVFGAGMFVSARELPPVPQLRELEDTYGSLLGSAEEEWWTTPSQGGEPVQTLLPDRVEPGLVRSATSTPPTGRASGPPRRSGGQHRRRVANPCRPSSPTRSSPACFSSPPRSRTRCSARRGSATGT